MVSKPALSPSEMRSLKLILTVSSSYYARILPLYRKSLEHRRLRIGVKNPKGLRVKIRPVRHVAMVSLPFLVAASPTFPVAQSNM